MINQEIDKITALFVENFAHLPTNKPNQQPNAQTWSIAQNIAHLIAVNESYFPIFEQVQKNTLPLPWHASWLWLVNYFGKLILQGVAPQNKKKVKTFAIWQPQQSQINENIISDFCQHQERLKDYVQKLSGFVEKNVVICSPANKNIVYTLPKALQIILEHEKRHLEQAKNVLAQLK